MLGKQHSLFPVDGSMKGYFLFGGYFGNLLKFKWIYLLIPQLYFEVSSTDALICVRRCKPKDGCYRNVGESGNGSNLPIY